MRLEVITCVSRSSLNHRFKIACVPRKMQIYCAGAEIHEKTRSTCVSKERSLASLFQVTKLGLRVWGGDMGTGTWGQFRVIGFSLGFGVGTWGPGHGTI